MFKSPLRSLSHSPATPTKEAFASVQKPRNVIDRARFNSGKDSLLRSLVRLIWQLQPFIDDATTRRLTTSTKAGLEGRICGHKVKGTYGLRGIWTRIRWSNHYWILREFHAKNRAQEVEGQCRRKRRTRSTKRNEFGEARLVIVMISRNLDQRNNQQNVQTQKCRKIKSLR